MSEENKEPQVQVSVNRSMAGDLVSIVFVSPVPLGNKQIGSLLASLSQQVSAVEEPQDDGQEAK